jgi:hypothetical protein
MSRALERLKRADPAGDPRYYAEAEMLPASWGRITGRTRGEIPLNPSLSSKMEDIETLRAQYHKLVDAWWDFLSSDAGKETLRRLGSAGR